ncbi:hypothetical protein DY251_09425 [Mesorhizobium denitrificans]|uniref:Uncharacterized protein n=1 Tax=Mesorhizobium denitrificans TaxID=2294114 RepID=A0A371XEZ2_9HYPH|nr:hypothetical protein DY251_09425 [Mesorhizobium denitrificans]
MAACIFALPAKADPTHWIGDTVALRIMERGIICSAGPISLSLDGDALKAKLTASGIELSGALKSNETLEMNGRKGARIYNFTGKREKDLLRGSWIDAGSGCGGTWRAKPDDQATKAN